MARKATNKIGNEVKAAAPVATAKTTTAVRNTAVPPKSAPAPVVASRKEVTHDQIARKAFEISMSPACGSEYDNWIRAEKELRGL